MAKRFASTEIWDEDWFLNMPIAYKLFWYYMLCNCDHAGLFKVNLRSFCGLNEVSVTSTMALELFNAGKQRLRVISTSIWLIEDFFVFQYGTTFNPNNKVHESIENLYKRHGIEMTSIRGLRDLKERVKDKDKEIKKGGTGENKKAIEVNGNMALFEDGSSQVLGNEQSSLLEKGYLKVREIVKGVTY